MQRCDSNRQPARVNHLVIIQSSNFLRNQSHLSCCSRNAGAAWLRDSKREGASVPLLPVGQKAITFIKPLLPGKILWAESLESFAVISG